MYFRDADPAIVVSDMTSSQSFHELDGWLKALSEQGPETIVVALAGNKCDLERDRSVSPETAIQFVADNGIPIYLETLALSGENVDEIFKQIAKAVVTGWVVLGARKQSVKVDEGTQADDC
jgi:Ras-related protein Rab-5C